MLRTITPIDNTVYVERDFANYDQIEKALDSSKKLQIQWKNTPLTERIKNFKTLIRGPGKDF